MELIELTLQGKLVSLEPICSEHFEEVLQAGQDPSIWQWMTFALNVPEIAQRFIESVSKMPKAGMGMGFAIRCNSTGNFIGSSGYWHVDHIHQKLEIGGTWITPDRQRSGANTEAKFLLLENAFENLQFKRVGFSIDTRNEKSLAAIARIGAIKEGVQRSDMTLHDGSDRDSAIFSIITSEWPAVKSRLRSFLASYDS
ncbi:GNAT family N-acetyltransferase [Oceanicoccus sp. KOV_DT_Chl]|uniref:GNAT family N-acetyltransferase n=1 Tax=Oceanicoccus sp. KOV_DT_Chl TaxID=1904639 RepID=UPI001358767B|nr:GNAT family protein [Oceanicoccus sp. KOV_DT_Chl]